VTERLIDPTGKRALFSSPGDDDEQTAEPRQRAEGRAALFSTPRRSPGTVVIECSDCKVRSRESLIGLGRRLATGSLWLPLGRHQHWVRCPSCGQRRWCRIGWFE
jgi:hypothetical protein